MQHSQLGSLSGGAATTPARLQVAQLLRPQMALRARAVHEPRAGTAAAVCAIGQFFETAKGSSARRGDGAARAAVAAAAQRVEARGKFGLRHQPYSRGLFGQSKEHLA